MTGAEFLVDYLISLGVTDVFGLPGGVVLDFLYELDRRKQQITAHLNYHEQCAGFAASGYAQLSGKLGVAYATKGPGITNLITPIADAFSDSTPVLVITAHSEKTLDKKVRFTAEQELNTVDIFKPFTKYAVRIDSEKDFPNEVKKACILALEGRKGPVLIDVLSNIFSENVSEKALFNQAEVSGSAESVDYVVNRLKSAHRPVFLIGDGIHQSATEKAVCALAEKARIPVLSGRCSQDIMPYSEMYYGYIGSHGIRYANFILSKADLIIAFGNRLAFSIKSESFKQVYEKAELIWVEIDSNESRRSVPNCKSFNENIKNVIEELLKKELEYREPERWKEVCDKLRNALFNADVNFPVKILCNVFKTIDDGVTIVNDVGNNEFWSSRAYIYSKIANRTLYSKCFGALGCALGKSIGVYYASKRPVLCVTGDQGLQFNIQELQYIGMNRLPITILLLNNRSSGMIRSREKQRYDRFVHTTFDSGYGTPDFKKAAEAYGIKYLDYSSDILIKKDMPELIEIKIDEDIDLEPNLPRGNSCQKLVPLIDKTLFDELDRL